MSFSPGRSSEANLVGVSPPVVTVVRSAYELTTIDFSIICGLRTRETQAALVKAGASKTLNSAHLYGKAIDFQPYLGPGVSPYPKKGDSPAVVREKLARFEEIARAFFQAADELGVLIQWGNDWDCDGIPTGRDPDEKGWLQDLVHVQEVPESRKKQAKARSLERIAARARGEAVIS